jgi:hypothetical protein
MVVVADAGFEASRRPGRLNTPDEAFADQQTECVVHGLQGNGADLGPHGLRHAVGGDVGLTRHRPQDGQPLGRHVNTAFTKEEIGLVGRHDPAFYQ